MSIKNFEGMFNNLNNEFVDLKSKIDGLINKYADMEKQLEKQKKYKFNCRNCNKKFENPCRVSKP